MSKTSRRTAVSAAFVTVIATLAVFAAPAGANNIGNQGCTPGYWKNHTDNWEEYSPDQTLDTVFVFPASLASFGDQTMLEALAGGGGPGVDGATKILLRASVAAFLNAAHEGLGYPYRRYDEPGELGPTIKAALASGDRATMLALASELDAANNLGCPLGNETTTPTTPPAT